MTEKVWGLTPRWDGTQGLMQWAQIIFGWLMGLLILATVVQCSVEEAGYARHPETRYEVTYQELEDGTVVKCMYDNSWDETFACDWPSKR